MNMPLNIDWQQILLHILSFVILAGGLYLLLYKPVKEFMNKRIEHFRGLEQDAVQALKKAEIMKSEYEKQLQKADEEIEQQILTAKRESEEICRKELQKAQRRAEDIVSDAKNVAEKEKEKILDDAQKQIVGIVAMATEKLLLEKTAVSTYDQFFEAVEKEARNA